MEKCGGQRACTGHGHLPVEASNHGFQLFLYQKHAERLMQETGARRRLHRSLRSRLSRRSVVSQPVQPHIGLMPHLGLSDDEAAVLIKKLHDTVHNDRYPFSGRIRTLKAILGKLSPEPVRE